MNSVDFLIALAAILIFSIALKTLRSKKSELKILYLDEGRKTPTLYSKTYDLSGKPDAIVRDQNGEVALIEYKSRLKNIYLSDVVQAKAGALVARENNFPVKYALIKTKQHEERIELPKSNAALYRHLTPFISQAREARRGKVVKPNANKFKCGACGYQYTCKEAVKK